MGRGAGCRAAVRVHRAPEPGATGFVWHEWFGLGFIPLFVVHIVLSWRWITTAWGRIGSDPAPRARINFLLNIALFVMMTV